MFCVGVFNHKKKLGITILSSDCDKLTSDKTKFIKVHFTVTTATSDLTASTLGFPGGSLGREGGRGGGGGGVGLTDEGVAGRTGEEEPAEVNSNTFH